MTGTTLSATRFCAYHSPPVYHHRRRYRPRTIWSHPSRPDPPSPFSISPPSPLHIYHFTWFRSFLHLPREIPPYLRFPRNPQSSTPLRIESFPSRGFLKWQTAELPFIPCPYKLRERRYSIFHLLTRLFHVNTFLVALFRFRRFALAPRQRNCASFRNRCELRVEYETLAESIVAMEMSLCGNLTSCERSAPLLQIEPSYFGHPIERFSILLSRAPACHSVRGCFRFRRPRGNNPSLRSQDHVEDCVSFSEYYGFLYSDVCMYIVHIPCIRIYIDRMYMCIYIYTAASMFPYNAKEASWKSYGSSASACKYLVWNCGNEMHEILLTDSILHGLSWSSNHRSALHSRSE